MMLLCASTSDCSIRRCSSFFKFANFSNLWYEVVLHVGSLRVLKANAFVDSSFSDGPLFRPRNSKAAYSKWDSINAMQSFSIFC